MSAFLVRMLAESSLRSALLVTAAAAILKMLRVRDAGPRHAVLTAAMCTMMLMPALLYAVPAIDIPVPAFMPSVQVARDVDANLSHAIERTRAVAESKATDVQLEVGSQPESSTATAIPPAPWQATMFGPLVALSLYAGGALLVAARFGFGWRKAARIARHALPADVRRDLRPFGVAEQVAICESAAIVTPVTIGALAPVILLPLAWRRWSDEQLRAVLAHEMAHVRRHDPLVNLLAHANRCLFWFHPAAWWLQRALAAAAEQSCDEAAVRVVGAPDAYAQLLIDMAHTIRHGRGRLAWRDVGMDGNGLLSQRIDHVLGGASRVQTSPAVRAIASVCCAVAALLFVACRPQPTSLGSGSQTETEQRDRKLRLDLEQVSTRRFSAWTVGSSELPPAESLDAAVNRHPDDLEALRSLLVSYWIEAPADLAKRRDRILWLIAHHPDAPLAGSVEARLFSTDLDPSFPGDPAGFEQAKAMWLEMASVPNANIRILGNAAAFFEVSDASRAEQLLLRARASDPAGPWVARLGRLYADVLAGSDAPWPPSRSRRLTAPDPGGAFGLRIRKTLSETRDEELLTAAGWFLARGLRGPSVFRGFDPDRWAETCFRRALEVNRHAVLARTSLLELHGRLAWSRGEPLWSVPPAQLYDSVASRPEAERFELLPGLARDACRRIESLARWNDDPLIRDRIELSRQQARRFAEDALVLAPRYRNHPQYGTAIFLANMTLGTLALREGDRITAALFLRKAARAPVSEELAYSKGMASNYQWHLATELLKQGERGAVLDFLDRMAATSVADRFELREAAAEVRRGGTPRF